MPAACAIFHLQPTVRLSEYIWGHHHCLCRHFFKSILFLNTKKPCHRYSFSRSPKRVHIFRLKLTTHSTRAPPVCPAISWHPPPVPQERPPATGSGRVGGGGLTRTDGGGRPSGAGPGAGRAGHGRERGTLARGPCGRRDGAGRRRRPRETRRDNGGDSDGGRK